MIAFARSLPALRSVVEHDIALGDMSREQVLACAARLLDRGFFRIGSEVYAVSNETYGLATMLKRHVTVDGETISFDYIAKESKRRVQAVIDPEVAEIVGTLKRRRGGGEELLAYKVGGRWCDVRSPDINAYLKAATGADVSAKDFRTWGATVLAAVGLAVNQPDELSAVPAQAGDHARGQGGRLLPRQHARRSRATPTSTRASSTATATARRSSSTSSASSPARRRSRGRSRRPCSTCWRAEPPSPPGGGVQPAASCAGSTASMASSRVATIVKI